MIIDLAYSSTALIRSQDSAKELEDKMRRTEQEARDLERKKRLAEEEREKTRKENLSQKQKTEAMVDEYALVLFVARFGCRACVRMYLCCSLFCVSQPDISGCGPYFPTNTLNLPKFALFTRLTPISDT